MRIPTEGFSSAYLSDESNLGQALCYIRPIQIDLDLGTLNSQPSEACKECLKCGEMTPINLLRDHVLTCNEADHDGPQQKRRRTHQMPVCQFACATGSSESQSVEKNDWSSCPLCGIPVPSDEIEVHADICCENAKSEEPQIKVSRSLDEALNVIRNKLQQEKKWTVSVIRKSLIDTTMEMLSDADIEDFSCYLNVKFMGEEGVDAGGLRRELFSLFFQQTKLLEDNTFSNDSFALQNGHYILLGKMTSLAFIYGHPGIQRLHETLLTYILTETTPSHEVCTEDVHNATVRHAVSVIENAASENDYIQAAVEVGDLLERSGFTKKLMTDSAKLAIYTLKEYHIFYRAFPALRQYMEGLKLHGVLDLLREHPMEARKFLTNTASISAEDICKFYLFSFSEKDSENRQIEEKIEYNFRRLLSQIEKGRISSVYVSPYDEQQKEIHVTLGDVLQAFIGCPSLPRDISSGLVEFNHNSFSLSVVNTCAPSILLQNTSKLQDFENFKQSMLNIILGAEGFGQE